MHKQKKYIQQNDSTIHFNMIHTFTTHIMHYERSEIDPPMFHVERFPLIAGRLGLPWVAVTPDAGACGRNRRRQKNAACHVTAKTYQNIIAC